MRSRAPRGHARQFYGFKLNRMYYISFVELFVENDIVTLAVKLEIRILDQPREKPRVAIGEWGPGVESDFLISETPEILWFIRNEN